MDLIIACIKREGQVLWVGMLFVCFVILIFFSGCTHYVTSAHRVDQEPSSNDRSGRVFEANSCSNIFPKEEKVEFPITYDYSPEGTLPPVLTCTLEANCHYDLGIFECACECECGLDQLILDGPFSPDDQIKVAISTPGGDVFPPLTFTFNDGVIHLDESGIDLFMEDGVLVALTLPNDVNPRDVRVTAGGLCVVVNVDGGGS